MSVVVRFVQEYRPADRAAFLELEARFAETERRRDDWPTGVRMQTFSGPEPTHALVWEATFASMAEAFEVLARMSADAEHEALFERQAPLIRASRTEIYEVLDL